MEKLVIFDKDGTLAQTISGEVFINDPNDQKLIDGVFVRLHCLHRAGWKIAIVSNQGGVAAGHKTIKQAIEEMHNCIGELPCSNVEAFICPDMAGEQCYRVMNEPTKSVLVIHAIPEYKSFDWIGTFRKRTDGGQGSGMLRLAMRNCLSDHYVVMVGDRDEDRVAAEQCGIDFVTAEDWLADKSEQLAEPYLKVINRRSSQG